MEQKLNEKEVTVENRSTNTLGILVKGEWINFESTSEAKKAEIKTLMEGINRGDLIKIKMGSDENHYTDFELIKKGE